MCGKLWEFSHPLYTLPGRGGCTQTTLPGGQRGVLVLSRDDTEHSFFMLSRGHSDPLVHVAMRRDCLHFAETKGGNNLFLVTFVIKKISTNTNKRMGGMTGTKYIQCIDYQANLTSMSACFKLNFSNTENTLRPPRLVETSYPLLDCEREARRFSPC